MKIALAQMCSGIDPDENARQLRSLIAEAAAGDAAMIFTPEMTGLLDRDRSRAAAAIRSESEDVVLLAARSEARQARLWVPLGSLAVKAIDSSGEKWLNRSYLINPDGAIAARYDKIHLFDVDISPDESQRESSAYAGGHSAVVAPIPGATLGLSICYDLRFPALYEALTNAGADVLSIPAAFTVPTGKAHWEILLRARAIEAGARMVALLMVTRLWLIPGAKYCSTWASGPGLASAIWICVRSRKCVRAFLLLPIAKDLKCRSQVHDYF